MYWVCVVCVLCMYGSMCVGVCVCVHVCVKATQTHQNIIIALAWLGSCLRENCENNESQLNSYIHH